MSYKKTTEIFFGEEAGSSGLYMTTRLQIFNALKNIYDRADENRTHFQIDRFTDCVKMTVYGSWYFVHAPLLS